MLEDDNDSDQNFESDEEFDLQEESLPDCIEILNGTDDQNCSILEGDLKVGVNLGHVRKVVKFIRGSDIRNTTFQKNVVEVP